MLDTFYSNNSVLVRDEQDTYSRVTVYQTRTKTMAKGLVKYVREYMKSHGLTINLMEVSEPTKGLKTKNWYVRIVHHNPDIPF